MGLITSVETIKNRKEKNNSRGNINIDDFDQAHLYVEVTLWSSLTPRMMIADNPSKDFFSRLRAEHLLSLAE